MNFSTRSRCSGGNCASGLPPTSCLGALSLYKRVVDAVVLSVEAQPPATHADTMGTDTISINAQKARENVVATILEYVGEIRLRFGAVGSRYVFVEDRVVRAAILVG